MASDGRRSASARSTCTIPDDQGRTRGKGTGRARRYAHDHGRPHWARVHAPIVNGTIRATDLRRSRGGRRWRPNSNDPAYLYTASCRSTITYIDGEPGIPPGATPSSSSPRRGGSPDDIPAPQGELPTSADFTEFEEDVRFHTYVDTNVQKFLEGFRETRTPWACFLGAVGALRLLPGREADRRRPGRRLQAFGSSRSRRRSPPSSSRLPACPTCPPDDLDYIENF